MFGNNTLLIVAVLLVGLWVGARFNPLAKIGLA